MFLLEETQGILASVSCFIRHLLDLFVPRNVFLVACAVWTVVCTNVFPHWGLMKFSNLMG